jgi:hypothetical protein
MANDTTETRLRRMAKRRGVELVKSRRRDPGAIGFGQFHIRELWSNRVIGVLPRGIAFDLRKGGLQGLKLWIL